MSDISTYLSAVVTAASALEKRKDEVNRLNVFPVPDGDTGTNMSLTMQTVIKELRALGPNPSVGDVRKAITHGSLMGARGNSGVITSQILRGVCEGMGEVEQFDAFAVDVCMSRAVEVAFQAVRKPVEGTILTVVRDSAEAVHEAVEQGLDLTGVLHTLADAALASVRRTPELLPVLKENGVVDAGGFGLYILIEAFVASVCGEGEQIAEAEEFTRPQAKVEIEQINDWAGSKYLYCTEFLLHGDKIDRDEVAAFLPTMGDCDLIVGEIPHFKVHVHTDSPGTVLSYMTERGQISNVFIHNMKLQSEDRNDALAAEEAAGDATREPTKQIGFVAVASGEGNVEILKSLGVDVVITGGQTMNPSTADILEGIEQVDAESVIVLPDNGNIIMAAQAAAENAGKPVGVVPTRTVPAAFSAMFYANPQASLDDNVAAMTAGLEDVVCGEVTQAIKDSQDENGGPIAEGDYIGISAGAIKVVGEDLNDVTLRLIEKLVDDDKDTLTLLAGAEIPDDDFEELASQIEDRFDVLDVDAHRGGQPLYPVIFSLE